MPERADEDEDGQSQDRTDGRVGRVGVEVTSKALHAFLIALVLWCADAQSI